MPREVLALGTHGAVRYQASGKSWRARCLYRDYDGVNRDVERTGSTKPAARGKLMEAIRDREPVNSSAEITGATKVAVVCEAWWAGFAVAPGSPGTKRIYRDRLDRQILISLGNLRVRELTIGVVERFLRAVEAGHGASITKTTRSVLSNVCAYAARLDALDRNPVRETSPISVKPKRAPKALTLLQLRQLRSAVTYDSRATDRDVVDLIWLMIATGFRLGEALAITWDAIDLKAETVEVRGTVVREKGVGLYIKPEPKTEAGFRTVRISSWCVTMLRCRKSNSLLNFGELNLAFPSNRGTLRDPANIDDMVKDALTDAGIPDTTSHVFRKTVASLLDDAGIPARQISDQLGHKNVSMTMDVYMGRGVVDTGAARVLASLD